MLRCSLCKTELLDGTKAAEDRLCIPCAEERPLFDDKEKNVRRFSKRLDSQLIELTKISDKPNIIEYEVTCSLWDYDPRFRSRSIKVGNVTGIFRICRKTGDISVIYPVAYDDGRVTMRAKRVLEKAILNGEFPDKTGWASG